MRKKLHVILTSPKEENLASMIYDDFMLFIIVISIVPLGFKQPAPFWNTVDQVCALIFCVDYLLRWSISDLSNPNAGKKAFWRYPFSFLAVIDLISIIPSFTPLNSSFKLLRLLRLGRALRVLKILRYSESLGLIINVVKTEKHTLLSVGYLAIGYIILSALVMYQVEPESFNSFFDAVYWATTSLTTVGYGDIYPVTSIGKFVTMISSFVGIAVVALPSGILTAGYMKELVKEKGKD